MVNKTSSLVEEVFGTGRLFTGMLYLMLGAFFAYSEKKIHTGILVVLVAMGVIFQIFPIPFVSPLTFVLIPAVIFYVSVNLNIKDGVNAYFFRKSSTVMYFTHMFILFLYTLFFKEFPYFGWDAFVLSVFIPLLLTPLVLRYENKFPFLKRIF